MTPAPPTTSERLIQVLISAFVRWVTPIVLAGIVAGLNWFASKGHQESVAGIDPQTFATEVVSALAVMLSILLTILIRILTKHVTIFQQVLHNKGLIDIVDGWFGQKSLDGTVEAINNGDVTITEKTIQRAEVVVKAEGEP